MSLVPALLQAIVRVDGEALVMHAGDKPYVVAPTEQVDLASRGLTLEAVNGIVSQLLPPELQSALDEFGAVQHELAAVADFPGEHFTVVAARGGDDVWVEIRRRRIPEDDRVPDEFFGPAHMPPPQPIVAEAIAAAPPAGLATPVVYDNDELPVEMLGFDTATVVERVPGVLEAVATPPAAEVAPIDEDLTLPDESHLWPGQTAAAAHVASGAAAVGAPFEDVEIEIDLDVDESSEAAAAEAAREEAARIAAEQEAARIAAEAAQREAERLAAEETARLAAEEAAREAARIAAEEEAARLAAEAAQREAERLAAEEAARVAAEEAAREAARIAAEEEAARLAAEEAAREAARIAAEEEAARLVAEAAQREAERLAAEEAARLAAEEAAREAARIAAEEEVARLAAEEAQREAERVAAEEAARLAAEEAAREAARIAAEEEAARLAAEKAQREAERVAAEEAARLAAEEAAREAARIAAEEEAARLAASEAQREAERLAAEEAARVAAEQEAARIAAEEEAARVAAEEAAREAVRVAAEEEAARVAAAEEAAREAARIAAEQEAARLATEAAQREAERLAAEEEAARVAAEEAAREAAWMAAEEEAARVAAEEEAAREAARVAAEQEAARIAAEQEAARVAAEEEAARIAAAEETVREAARIAAGHEAYGETPWLAPLTSTRPFDVWPIAVSVEAVLEAGAASADVADTPEIAASLESIHAPELIGASPWVPFGMPPAERETVIAADPFAGSSEIDRAAEQIAASIAASDEMPALVASAETPQQAVLDETWPIPSSYAPPIEAEVEAWAGATLDNQQMDLPAPISRIETVHEAVASPQMRALPPQPAVVLNISRSPILPDAPPPAIDDPMLSGLERLLRVSSARGASALYLSSDSRPSVRVDGELQMLDGEPIHVARDVESLLLTLMPERSHEALRTGAATEWILDLEGVGRVRCMSFRDQRGPGGVFRLMPTRSVSADQLGLPKQVQALATEQEGLVLFVGARSSGKRTTMAAFVDLMNRTRRDHIITIEREINIQHERGNSFISQRELRGSDDHVLAATRAALREDPDVLVVEELGTAALMNAALDAAAAGRLVVGGFTAHTATGAIDRIIDLYAPEQHRQIQMALADSMRGVVAQVLLRKIGGGRLPAREVLLNTPAVSSVIAEGKTSQLPMAIEGGRGHGMIPLNDSLVGLVRNGSVDAHDAYRHSPDRAGFLAALNRQGIDTSFVERLANG
jgi:pilus retraction protein PilT